MNSLAKAVRPRARNRAAFSLFGAISLIGLLACGPDANSGGKGGAAGKWFKRAEASYRAADMDDAFAAATEAVRADKGDSQARILLGRIALARLDFSEALKATEGLSTTDAHMIRGRAYWYAGEVDRAADELDAMLRDPEVRDPWAKEISKLSRRGHGRKPFSMEGAMVAAVDMPQAGPLLVVPCELDGENILAIVSTGIAELTIDSTSRKEAAWVSLRFGDRFEVHDVPALTQDLGALSKQLGAPIKALLGVNLLRHLHVTFDRRASQFVVRRQDPAAPPDASRVPLAYIRGGGMTLRVNFSSKKEVYTNLLVDTSAPYPLALSDKTWIAAGVSLNSLKPDPQLPPTYKAGKVPFIRLGSFDLPDVPAIAGADMEDVKARIDVDFGGIMGSGFLYPFRVTFGDEGRFAWLEGGPMQESPSQESGPATKTRGAP